MEIKVLEKTEGCMPEVFKVGDWYDLKLAEDVRLKAPYAKTLKYKTKGEEIERTREVVFDSVYAKLGICMQLPKGFEAVVVPRSSTFKRYGVIQSNSEGVIDQLYCGDTDEWKMPLLSFRTANIPKGTRIAQFRIQLSQKATMWQKIKWLFSSKIVLKKVKYLDAMARGGFGSTGK